MAETKDDKKAAAAEAKANAEAAKEQQEAVDAATTEVPIKDGTPPRSDEAVEAPSKGTQAVLDDLNKLYVKLNKEYEDGPELDRATKLLTDLQFAIKDLD